VGPAVGDALETQIIDQTPGTLLAAATGTRQARRQQHVLLAAQLLDQVEGLKDEADVAQTRARERPRALGNEIVTGEHDPPAVGAIEATEQVQERRLAAARPPKHSDDFALLHIERNIVEHPPRRATRADGLRDPVRLQNLHRADGTGRLLTPDGVGFDQILEMPAASLSLPRISLGCGNFGGIGSAPAFFGQGLGRDEAFAVMDAAWELGIRHFDTADAYGGGRSEQTIGDWMRARGVRPMLTTKTFNPMEEGADHGLAPDRIARQLDSSLKRLGVSEVDLSLAHDFDADVPVSATFGAFDELVAAGTIRAYGVSNFGAEQLRAALAVGRPQAVQNSYSLLERGDGSDRGVLSVCAEHGVSYLVFSPLAGGWLTGKYRRGGAFPARSRMTQRPSHTDI
jgi:aryl-alcohol dehydrogenase-like predicted oxidoreductase